MKATLLTILSAGFCVALAQAGDADPVLETMTQTPSIEEAPIDPQITNHLEFEPRGVPFSSMLHSVGMVNLNDWGYTEKEFFLSGTAHVYKLGDDERAEILSQDHPYTTRLLVRYPSNPERFNGRVYIDILNASSGVDLEDTWRRSWQHLMNEGYAYIGITSKSVTANALKRYDAVRYAPMNWQVNGQDENGLFWDMLSQLGTLLRMPEAGIFGGLEPEYVYLGGQSQSGFYLNTYLTAFGDRLETAHDGAPLFDGYLNLVGPGAINIRTDPESPDAFATPGYAPKTLYKPTSVPQIVIMSEAEHAFYSAGFPPYTRPTDSDAENNKFRFYEVAGAPHADPTSPILPSNYAISRANNGNIRAPKIYDEGHVETELNIDPIVSAAIENMHLWAAEGVLAPPAQPLWTAYSISEDDAGNEVYTPERDKFGNARGGVRLPQIAAPLYRFYAFRNDAQFDTDGSMVRLSEAQKAELYPNGREDYLEQFDAATDKLVEGRYLLESDAVHLKSWAREQPFWAE